MKLVISLTILALCQVQASNEYNTVCIQNHTYEEEILKEDINNPYQMVIDYSTNTLFFSYSIDSEKDKSDVFKSAYLNLKSSEYDTIPGIKGGFAAAVDNNKHEVYLGGREGLHKFDYATGKASLIDSDGHSVWQMFFKDKLYYTTYPDEEAYIFDGTTSTRIHELADTRALLIAVDKNNDMYFSNSSGLFFYSETMKTFTNLKGEYNLNSFARDRKNNLYFSTPEGFFAIDEKHNVKQLAHIHSVYGLAIEDDDNLIYGSENEIIRLTKTENTCDGSENEINRT